jgi:hypothetical protein
MLNHLFLLANVGTALELTKPVKIAVLGDSISLGNLPDGMPIKSWPSHLQSMLELHGDKKFEVKNFSVSGASPCNDFVTRSMCDSPEYKYMLNWDADVVLMLLFTNEPL